jgi:CRP-like cAMP-binding protein
LQVVKRTSGLSFHLPLTQVEVADVLGLSVVHMNRIIRELRETGLFTWAGHTVTILDWDRLQGIAEFDPTYLSLSPELR